LSTADVAQRPPFQDHDLAGFAAILSVVAGSAIAGFTDQLLDFSGKIHDAGMAEIERIDGIIELHGRDSVTINSGGEKIFAEEVEAAVKAHPAVYDCVVAGRPSERWGNEVVAVVRIREGYTVTDDDLRAEAERHIARYKLPKQFVYVDDVVRSPSGKADYRWAKQQAAQA
jgi:acyl-CoA synthetase (AMP-forming)/AMP-acid ligase II